jgi:hypothetical protein
MHGPFKPQMYRVYLCWDRSLPEPTNGIAYLTTPSGSRAFTLRGEAVLVRGVHQSPEFLLIDDPEFTEENIPGNSKQLFLKVLRRRLFGREFVQAVPVGAPPKGYVLSGRTGRFVWGGGDFTRNISPRPIPLRYWIKDRVKR